MADFRVAINSWEQLHVFLSDFVSMDKQSRRPITSLHVKPTICDVNVCIPRLPFLPL